MAKMTLNKLIKELKELKNSGVWENDIPTIKNLLVEYQNDSNMWTFEDLSCQMVSFESVMEDVSYKANKYDFWGVQRIMEGLEKADRYRDNGDYYENIDSSDVEERLDEIIDYAKSFKS